MKKRIQSLDEFINESKRYKTVTDLLNILKKQTGKYSNILNVITDSGMFRIESSDLEDANPKDTTVSATDTEYNKEYEISIDSIETII